MSDTTETTTEAPPEDANETAILEALDSDETDIGVPAAPVHNEKQPEQAASDGGASGGDEESVGSQDSAPDMDGALSALKRDGLSQAIIDKMSEEEILELGAKRAKVQSDTDNAYRELGELKKSGNSESNETATESEVAEPADQPVEGTLEDTLKPFADIFGDDAADALQIYGKTTVEPLATQLQAQQAMLEQLLLDRSRQSLGERFPNIATDEGYASVQQRMQTLVKSGEYRDIDTLMADAARIEFSDTANEAALEYEKKKLHQKSSGQMTQADKASTPAGALSNDEREDMLLDALDRGMPLSEAKRMFGS